MADAGYRHRVQSQTKIAAQKQLNEEIVRLAAGCKVTMSDSKNAGNCPAGTRQFAQNQGVPDPSIYDGLPADKLLAIGGRAAIAAKFAILRQTEWSV